ncbi:MAG: hypothetical protein F4Y00_04260 [Bacteroidetes bacterium SB0662_bin_6]|nr:hypothetical protein [Bacteroidetes bacterium SB0668_bin_1]MYE04168.1 hypothetical protein [Bacteroidetes bacterium SB0662_bin_6]
MRGLALFVLLCVLLSTSGCGPAAPGSTESSAEGAIVATVDGEPIYARDFVLNYELGFPHLHRGDNTRLAYLSRIIDEKLLALEGIRRGLLDHAEVRRNIEDLREELLVEQVFQRYVNDQVSVTPEDITLAMQQDRTSFQLRYLPARSSAEGHRLRDEALRVGLPALIREFVSSNDEQNLHPSDFESPYVTSHDLHPDLMAAIIDLPIGEISAPVPYHGQYLLLQLVDVRREPVSPSATARATFEQVVFHQKASVLARTFIGSMMKPLDVRLKPASYRLLREELWHWYQEGPPQGNLLTEFLAREASDTDNLRVIPDDVLITTSDGDWTVRDFLAAFPAARYPLRHERREVFENDLYDAIGLTLRDHYFVQRALEENMDEDPALRHELALWTDKWVYRVLREELADSEETVGETLRRLREHYPVVVHHAVLDTLTLSTPNNAGLTVLKGHTLRPAFPVADPVW